MNYGVHGPVKQIREITYETSRDDDYFYKLPIKKSTVDETMHIECNEAGQIVFIRRENNGGRNTLEYTYDLQGRLAERHIYYNNGSLSVKNVVHYGDDGRVEKILSYDGDDDMRLFWTSVVSYFPDKMKIVDYSDGETYETTTMNLRGETILQEGGWRGSLRYRYTYDDRGNWIVCKQYPLNGSETTPAYITKRTITYW